MVATSSSGGGGGGGAATGASSSTSAGASSADGGARLKKFHPSMLPTEFGKTKPLIFIGESGMGKTTAMLHILHHQRKLYKFGVAISLMEAQNKTFCKIMPDTFVYTDYKTEIVENYYEYQRKAVKLAVKDPERHGPREKYLSVLICDDCLIGNSITKDRVMETIFKAGGDV